MLVIGRLDMCKTPTNACPHPPAVNLRPTAKSKRRSWRLSFLSLPRAGLSLTTKWMYGARGNHRLGLGRRVTDAFADFLVQHVNVFSAWTPALGRNGQASFSWRSLLQHPHLQSHPPRARSKSATLLLVPRNCRAPSPRPHHNLGP